LLGIVVLAAVGLGGRFHVQVVQAQQTWNVQVGGDGPALPDPASGTFTLIGFLPSVVTVNVGDTVSWTFPSAEPHGVAFDNGHQPELANQANPGPGPGEFDVSTIFAPLGLDQVNGVFNPNVQFSSGVPTDPPGQRQP